MLKKNFVTLGVSIVLSVGLMTSCFAESLIDQPDIPNDNGISRTIQHLLGLNALADWAASRIIKKGIRKKLEGRFKVRLHSFSALSLTNGVARNLRIDGTHLVYDKALIIDSLHFETNEETPIWIDLKKGTLKAPIEADFKIALAGRGIQRSLEQPKIARILSNIKVPLAGMGEQRLAVTKPEVKLEANEILASARVNTVGQPEEKAIDATVRSGLGINPDTHWLDLTNFHVTATGAENTEALSRETEQVIESLIRPVKWLPKKYKQSQIVINSVQVLPDRVILTAHLTLIPPPPSTH